MPEKGNPDYYTFLCFFFRSKWSQYIAATKLGPNFAS